jgi:hypothetical protein
LVSAAILPEGFKVTLEFLFGDSLRVELTGKGKARLQVWVGRWTTAWK